MENYSGLNGWFGLQQSQIDDIKEFIYSRLCNEKHENGHYCYRMSQEKFDQMKEEFDLSTPQLAAVISKICQENEHCFNLAQLVIYPVDVRNPATKDLDSLSFKRLCNAEMAKLCNQIDRLIVMMDVVTESRNFTQHRYETHIFFPIEQLSTEDDLSYLECADVIIPLLYVNTVKAWYESLGFVVTNMSYKWLKIEWDGSLEKDDFVADVWIVPKNKKIALHNC